MDSAGDLDRTRIQQAYIRVCRDSRFQIEPVPAAHLAAAIAPCHPLQVWIALGLDNMERIAAGNHPCLSRFKETVKR